MDQNVRNGLFTRTVDAQTQIAHVVVRVRVRGARCESGFAKTGFSVMTEDDSG
jgi:hypothetical protein